MTTTLDLLKVHAKHLARVDEVQKKMAAEEFDLIMTEEGNAVHEAIKLVMAISGEVAETGHKYFSIYIYSEPNIGTRPSVNGWRVALAMVEKSGHSVRSSLARRNTGNRLIHYICGLRRVDLSKTDPVSVRCSKVRPDLVFTIGI